MSYWYTSDCVHVTEYACVCLHVQYDHQTYSDTILDVSKSEIVSLENIEMGEQLVQ